MTRTGKIARLPHGIREQLNHRLADGEQGKNLVQWLNALPEVQQVVQVEFNNRPIRAQNISEWRKRGFREWQLQQDALEQIPLVVKEAQELNAEVGGQLTDHLTVWLTARLMATIRRLAATDLTTSAHWKLFREACAILVALRRGDQNNVMLSLERDRLMYLKDDLTCRYKKRIVMGMEALIKLTEEKHPGARAALDTYFDQIRGPLDNISITP